MLGLRRIGGVQLDVWVGDGSLFDCDIKTDSPQKVLELLGQHRHVSLNGPDSSQVCRDQVYKLVEEIQNKEFFSKKRLTLIFRDLEGYHKIKQMLFDD